MNFFKQERFQRLWPFFLSAFLLAFIIPVLFSILGVYLKYDIWNVMFGAEFLLGLLIGLFNPNMARKELRMATPLPAMLFFFYYHSILPWIFIDPRDWVEDIGFAFLGSCVCSPIFGQLLFGAIYASISIGVLLRQRITKER